MFNDNEFNKMLGEMDEKEMKVLNKFMNKMLDVAVARLIMENPDSIEAKKALLSTQLMKTDIGKVAMLLSKCPDDEFSKHETNLKLVVETLQKEEKALEKIVGGV